MPRLTAVVCWLSCTQVRRDGQRRPGGDPTVPAQPVPAPDENAVRALEPDRVHVADSDDAERGNGPV